MCARERRGEMQGLGKHSDDDAGEGTRNGRKGEGRGTTQQRERGRVGRRISGGTFEKSTGGDAAGRLLRPPPFNLFFEVSSHPPNSYPEKQRQQQQQQLQGDGANAAGREGLPLPGRPRTGPCFDTPSRPRPPFSAFGRHLHRSGWASRAPTHPPASLIRSSKHGCPGRPCSPLACLAPLPLCIIFFSFSHPRHPQGGATRTRPSPFRDTVYTIRPIPGASIPGLFAFRPAPGDQEIARERVPLDDRGPSRPDPPPFLRSPSARCPRRTTNAFRPSRAGRRPLPRWHPRTPRPPVVVASIAPAGFVGKAQR